MQKRKKHAKINTSLVLIAIFIFGFFMANLGLFRVTGGHPLIYKLVESNQTETIYDEYTQSLIPCEKRLVRHIYRGDVVLHYCAMPEQLRLTRCSTDEDCATVEKCIGGFCNDIGTGLFTCNATADCGDPNLVCTSGTCTPA